LSASGYVTPTVDQQFPVQPESALSTIRLIIGPGSIALLLVSLPFAWRYPITRDSHKLNVQKIENSKNAQ
jgi:GPH family glycoside/pentoside/hexuronide:cation symporter